MRVPITLDLHLPNFNYPGVGPDAVFEKLVDIATTAEASGFSSVSLMDHLHQIGPVGPPENWMFDGNTMLAAIAARTSKLTLGTLVGGVTYRNPALLAKITTTLDVISGGRAWLGIGAAWFEAEHEAYGFDFPSLGRRFEYLEECAADLPRDVHAGAGELRRQVLPRPMTPTTTPSRSAATSRS